MLKKWVKEYITINKNNILIVIGIILLGIIIGVGGYVFSSNAIKQLAIYDVKEVLDISKTDAYVKTNIVINGIKSNVLLIILLAVFSVTLFGKWCIYGIVLLKGAALSIYSIILFNIFGPLWGIVCTLLLVVFVNILYIPAFIYLIITFLEINFSTFKLKTTSCNPGVVCKICLTIFLAFTLMFSSVMVEQIASTVVLKIYNKIL